MRCSWILTTAPLWRMRSRCGVIQMKAIIVPNDQAFAVTFFQMLSVKPGAGLPCGVRCLFGHLLHPQATCFQLSSEGVTRCVEHLPAQLQLLSLLLRPHSDLQRLRPAVIFGTGCRWQPFSDVTAFAPPFSSGYESVG